MADLGCLSRIPDPDFYPSRSGSRISDPGSKNSNKREVKKICYHTFFVVTNITKLNIRLFFKCLRKKFAIFKELLKFLPKKISICSQIYGFGIRDPGKKPIPDPGSRRQKGTGSRIRIRNTGILNDFLSVRNDVNVTLKSRVPVTNKS